MSKPIKMTEQYMAECRADFEKALQLTKLADGKLNFTKTFSIADKKAIVYFTGEAWTKMVMLIKEFDKEVAWHGVAHRVEDESKDEYVITDIMVYPQEVTGTTVEMDTEKYAMWLMENAEDERFDNIHMQAHSHVNMSTSPSGVDLNHQEEILNMLGDEDFYIFMIWNKSFTSTNKVYDLKKNILFEDKDITVKIIGGVEDLDVFIKGAKDMVKTKSYGGSGYGSGYNYGGYNYGQQYNKPVGAPYNPVASSKSDDKKSDKKDDKKNKKEEKPRTKVGAGWAGKNACQQSMFDDDDEKALFGEYDDDDENNPNSPFYYRGY